MDVTDTMTDLLACVVDGLDTADRPVCDSGITIGPPVIGPNNCCKCSDAVGQASVFLERVYPVAGNDFSARSTVENCRPGPVAADMTFVITRCYPAMKNNGQMPKLSETTGPSEDLNEDMRIVWAALRCCNVPNLIIRESAVDSDPEGGCSAFAVRVSVLVSMPATGGDVS